MNLTLFPIESIDLSLGLPLTFIAQRLCPEKTNNLDHRRPLPYGFENIKNQDFELEHHHHHSPANGALNWSWPARTSRRGPGTSPPMAWPPNPSEVVPWSQTKIATANNTAAFGVNVWLSGARFKSLFKVKLKVNELILIDLHPMFD